MTISEELKNAIAKAQELQANLEKAEKAFKEAQSAYVKFTQEDFPDLLLSEGVTGMTIDDGRQLSVKVKTSASISKGEKKAVCEWLKANGGEAIVKESISTTPQYTQQLKAMNIPYEEVYDVNTLSLKSLLLEKLGQKGTPATITLADIPQGISFYQWREVEIK